MQKKKTKYWKEKLVQFIEIHSQFISRRKKQIIIIIITFQEVEINFIRCHCRYCQLQNNQTFINRNKFPDVRCNISPNLVEI